MSEVVGRVVGLRRFPIKSMSGEALEEAELRWRGLDGDRQYGFLIRGSRSRFPWFTGRDWSDLVRWQARYRDPADPRHSPVDVTAPDGEAFPLEAPELHARLGAAAGLEVDLVQLGRGAFDALPVSIVTTATLAAIEAARGHAVDPRRYRINIVVESDSDEGAWGERLLTFGDRDAAPRLIVQEPIERCVMITIDPETGVRSPGLMKTVARGFDNKVGIYASPARSGIIRLGDAVRLG